jgi:glyoxylase-like metal-dependent hydrolase (beta-lactamase superfamily II)
MIRTTLIAAPWSLPCWRARCPAAEVKVYNAGANSFHVNSTLMYGEKEALVIDAGFTRADALRIAANVLDSGKQLKTIYVSQADPDYYFGVETIKEIFPNADVVTTPAVLEKMNAKLAGKVAFWGPKMGVNAPRTPVLPSALRRQYPDGRRPDDGDPWHSTARWRTALTPGFHPSRPSSATSACLAICTCGRRTPKPRPCAPPGWRSLDEMAALQPNLVVPGHMRAGTALDASAIRFTKDYLQTFEKNLAANKTSATLIGAMQQSYPQVTDGAISLDIGAKVNTGEMKW